MSNLIHALDVSKYTGLVTQEEWTAAQSRGYTLAIVGAWHGTTDNPNAQNTLYNARQVGMTVAAYTVLNAEDGSQSVHEAFRACGDQAEHLAFMALDVEVMGLTHKIFNDARNSLVSADVKGCVYTRYSFWHDQLGNPRWGSDLPLWDADYNDGPNLVLDRPYGGWTVDKVIGKQYQGSTSRLGFNADLSVFAADWLAQRMP